MDLTKKTPDELKIMAYDKIVEKATADSKIMTMNQVEADKSETANKELTEIMDEMKKRP